MRNLKTVLGTLTLVTLLVSCSSVKITDTWKDVKTSDIKEKNVMVVGNTDSESVRLRFETDLVETLNQKGFTSTESFKIIPEVKPIEGVNSIQINKIKDDLKKNGIDVVIMTVLRDYQEYEESITTGGDTYYINTYPRMYYGRGYHSGFYGYYGSIYGGSSPITTITSTNKKYVLETLVYDLTLPEDKQLLTIITSEVDNPETLGSTSKDFSKQIVKLLNS